MTSFQCSIQKTKLFSLTVEQIFFLPHQQQQPSGERREGGARDGEQKDKKRKESILDLSKYLDKAIRVKFSGGREASGILKGFDQLLNLVLDNTIEYLRGMAYL